MNYTRRFSFIKVIVKIVYIQAFISFQIGFYHILHPSKSNNFEENVNTARTISHVNMQQRAAMIVEII